MAKLWVVGEGMCGGNRVDERVGLNGGKWE